MMISLRIFIQSIETEKKEHERAQRSLHIYPINMITLLKQQV